VIVILIARSPCGLEYGRGCGALLEKKLGRETGLKKAILAFGKANSEKEEAMLVPI